ncbi:hypothetical protein L6452_38069 [Arctium lappa]|uniref:Uncharacterized protein n=1 Tax=Arctium lappa TaxID=4217 RepID=A0ACB8Y5C5_ARCLA|nr:hypothetical protein L6452_38069 [Arctium lappa]
MYCILSTRDCFLIVDMFSIDFSQWCRFCCFFSLFSFNRIVHTCIHDQTSLPLFVPIHGKSGGYDNSADDASLTVKKLLGLDSPRAFKFKLRI